MSKKASKKELLIELINSLNEKDIDSIEMKQILDTKYIDGWAHHIPIGKEITIITNERPKL